MNRREKCTVVQWSAALFLLMLLPQQAIAVTAASLWNKPDEWFTSEEGIRLIDNIISHQLPEGGWEKGYDASQPYQPEPATHPANDVSSPWPKTNTIDNGATYTELRILARAYRLTRRPNVLESFNRGLDFLFMAQYPNGGWPQRYPLQNNYSRDITFNDNAMTAVMHLMRDVASSEDFAFVDPARRRKAQQAFDRGLDCILRCQIVQDGKLTAWAQQYDPQTLEPAKARAFELPGISGGESAAIVRLLMQIENPSPQVQRAIHAAVAWFQASKITGKRIVEIDGRREYVDDPDAEPLWARFYDIETNRPFFTGRDGIKRWSLEEIEPERRYGYAWMRPWGKAVLTEYAKWIQIHRPTTAPSSTVLPIRDNAAELLDRPDEWFASEQGKSRIDSIIAAQLPSGGWAKGYDPAQYAGAAAPGDEWLNRGTIDNGFTCTELRLLARAWNLTRRQEVLDAFNRGFDFLIQAQYPTGGWPQRWPLPQDYGRLITFNDDAMVNVMQLMKDVASRDEFAFVDADRRAKAKQAFDKGIDCILKSQIVVNGRLTAWCQQHDPNTLLPAQGRSYELPSIAARESVSIVRLLMSIENPSPQVRRAVHAAAAWLEASKITGLRLKQRADPDLPKGFDSYVVEDPSAGPLWARCYDIETNRPFFCGRDGVKKWSLAEIEPERRSYTWLGTWPKPLLEEYRQWAAKFPPTEGEQK